MSSGARPLARVAASLLALVLGLALAAALLVGIEGVFWLLNRSGVAWAPSPGGAAAAAPAVARVLPHALERPSQAAARMVHDAVPVPVDPGQTLPVDHQLFLSWQGDVLHATPDFRGPSILRARDGSVVYSTYVTTDAHGLRQTIHPAVATPPRRHLATIGCSFTWGVGVNDDETFASRLAALLPDRRVYNFGLPGGGPNDLLAREEAFQLFSAIREREGDALYLLIPDHVQRATGALSLVGSWAVGSAYEEEIAPGEFRFRGSWREAQPFRTQLFRLLANREVTRFFHLDWPRPDREALALTARMIAALRREYRAATDASNELTVVIHSTQGFDDADLRSVLDAEGLPYLDYSRIDWSRVTGEPGSIALDGHPTAPTYRALAQSVVEDLGLY